jgi:hypothetical protein
MTRPRPVLSRALLLLCSSLTLSWPALVRAADKVEEWTKLMPESARLVLSIRNTPELLKDWDASALGRFMDDEAVKRWMAPLYKDGVPAWDKSMLDISGSTFAENFSIYAGTTVSAFIAEGPEDFENREVRYVTLSEIAGKEAEMEAAKVKQLEAHRKKEHPKAAQVAKEIDGVNVKALAESDDADAEWLEGWAVVDGVLLEASDAELMEEMIGRLKGGAEKDNPLAGRLTRLTEIRGSEADLTFFVDLSSLIKMMQEKLTEEAGQNAGGSPFTPAQLFSALGMEELQGAALCVDFTDAHSRADFVLLHAEKPEGIVPALLRGSGTDVPQPAFMPADVAAGGVNRQSLAAIYDTLFKSILKLGPLAAMATMQITAMEQKAGMSLRNDLLGSLDDVYMQVETFSPGAAGSPPTNSSVTGFKLKNPERFQAAFDALLKLMGDGFGVFEESEFEGHKVFSMNKTAQGMIGYAIAGDYFFFMQGAPDLLHKVLRRIDSQSGPGFWDQPRTQAALAAIPPGYTGANVSNGSTIVRTVLTTMSQAQAMVPQGAGVPGGGKGPKGPKGPKSKGGGGSKSAEPGDTAWFDDSATPADEVFDRYFGMGASGFYSHPDATQILYISVPVEKQP